MADTFCGQCGARKKPLAYSTYCPNDCDRLVPRREPAEAVRLPPPCPACRTVETEPFPDCDQGDWHCLPWGHVWWGPNEP